MAYRALACGNDQSAMAQWLRELHPDYIYCFGWSYLLRKEILDLPKCGVIGFHPAALPHNRGRHPIIWVLVLGLNRKASTLFFMDEGADSGDILSQKTVLVYETDTAFTLYERITGTALEQLEQFTACLTRVIVENGSSALYLPLPGDIHMDHRAVFEASA